MSDWLTVTPTSGENNYNLEVSASTNSSTEKRYGVIIAHNDRFSLASTCFVTQDYSLSFDKERLYYEAGFIYGSGILGVDTLTITSNGNWTITNYPDWISISQLSGGSGQTTITVTASPNMGDERSGYIVFSTGNATINFPVGQGYASYIKYTTSTNDITTPNVQVISNRKYGDYCYIYLWHKDTVDAYSFSGNTDIETVEIHNVTSIEIYAFDKCSNLTGVTFDNKLTTIGNCAFNNIGNLDELTLPASLTGVGSGRWFDNITINKLNVACDLSGSSQWTSYDLNSAAKTAYTESVLGMGVSVNTVEMLSGSTARNYSLAFAGLSTIIINSGASFTTSGMYRIKFDRTDSSGTVTQTFYQTMPNATGTIIKPASMDWAKPYPEWTVQDA